MPLVELNAVGCPIGDISGIAKCPIQMLWLTDCPVENISALKTVPLVSVTLHRTKVKDLSPLSGTALQRLHIAETPVTDLSPLKGMRLTRLVFTPANITAGIEVAKSLPLQEIGTRLTTPPRICSHRPVFGPLTTQRRSKAQTVRILQICLVEASCPLPQSREFHERVCLHP
jgi:hypothetical protein